MSHKVKLSIVPEDGQAKLTAEGEIPDDEWAILESFHQFAGELISTKFVQDGMPSSLKMSGNSEDRITFQTQLPNWDDVVVFLHYLRPLYLQNEATSFGRVANIISRRLANQQMRGLIELQKRIYSGKLLQSGFRVSVNDHVVNSDEVLSSWLNSYEYHRDPDKRQFIEMLNQMLPLAAAQVLFIQLLVEKVKAIATLFSVTAVLLGHEMTTNALFPP